MALTPETGAGLADANSFCSLDFANDYHADRGNAAWDALDDTDDKVPALIRATDFITQLYGQRWAGMRATAVQALDWPRGYVPRAASLTGSTYYYPENVVPVEIQRACAELALKASTGTPLLADVGQAVTRVRVGPIEKEYAAGSTAQPRYAAVDALVAPFLLGGSSFGQIRLVRA